MATRSLEDLEHTLRDEETIVKALKDSLKKSENSEEQKRLENKVEEKERLLKEIRRQVRNLREKEQRIEKRAQWEKLLPEIDQAIDQNNIGYWISEDKFIFCRDYGDGQNNVQFQMIASSRIGRALSKMIGQSFNFKDAQEIIDYFETKGRTYLYVTSSFNRARWNERDTYNKMSVIRAHWLQPHPTETDYDPMIDVLLTAVCGGKEENLEHLEKWVAYKYLYPDRNANIPNLDIGGNPGGNGKGRFIEILKTIFTPSCVVQAHREELEKFNAAWEMAVILYYDEPEERELAAGKLKQATGSEDMRIEKKGIDATMADRNYNFIFLSNNEKGVVKLSGGSDGGEDRRYSVITTDLVLYDLMRASGLDDLSARSELDRIAQALVKNREQISRWLRSILDKHKFKQGENLPALHGADYHNRFEDQKDTKTDAFDRIIEVVRDQGFIPTGILCDVFRVVTEDSRHKDKSIMIGFEHYLKRQQIAFRKQDRRHWNSVWRNEEIKTQQTKCIVIEDSAKTEFDFSKIYTKRDSISLPLTKENCVLTQ
jgi:hypothetical protein